MSAMMRVLLALFALPLAAAVTSPSYDESVSMLNANSFDVIVDVRSEAEYEDGHIEGAVLLSRTDLDACADKKVAVYCWTGYDRSTPAARKLENGGFSDVYDLGGLQYLAPEGARVASSSSADDDDVVYVACADDTAATNATAATISGGDGASDGADDDSKAGCSGTWWIGAAILGACALGGLSLACVGGKKKPAAAGTAGGDRKVMAEGKPVPVKMELAGGLVGVVPTGAEVVATVEVTAPETTV